eukprot:g6478.t1
MAERLLAHGAKPNSVDRYERTPLHWAAQCGHADMVEALLLRRVDPDAQEATQGCSALHVAADAGHFDVVCKLLAAGCNRYLRRKDRLTALDVARDRRRAGVALILEHSIIPAGRQARGLASREGGAARAGPAGAALVLEHSILPPAPASPGSDAGRRAAGAEGCHQAQALRQAQAMHEAEAAWQELQRQPARTAAGDVEARARALRETQLWQARREAEERARWTAAEARFLEDQQAQIEAEVSPVRRAILVMKAGERARRKATREAEAREREQSRRKVL